eukprot:TRINITY_DN13551_c0_g1_i1.p1 TRINITY_DN13551_c0_g1~~TRINITY_DN13551_c0_g1_i1.p1  ORF type:complete len:368 (+),score=67.88 TRINITY_DN13551_c0_g1_i1:43-1146(+)
MAHILSLPENAIELIFGNCSSDADRCHLARCCKLFHKIFDSPVLWTFLMTVNYPDEKPEVLRSAREIYTQLQQWPFDNASVIHNSSAVHSVRIDAKRAFLGSDGGQLFIWEPYEAVLLSIHHTLLANDIDVMTGEGNYLFLANSRIPGLVVHDWTRDMTYSSSETIQAGAIRVSGRNMLVCGAKKLAIYETDTLHRPALRFTAPPSSYFCDTIGYDGGYYVSAVCAPNLNPSHQLAGRITHLYDVRKSHQPLLSWPGAVTTLVDNLVYTTQSSARNSTTLRVTNVRTMRADKITIDDCVSTLLAVSDVARQICVGNTESAIIVDPYTSEQQQLQAGTPSRLVAMAVDQHRAALTWDGGVVSIHSVRL